MRGCHTVKMKQLLLSGLLLLGAFGLAGELQELHQQQPQVQTAPPLGASEQVTTPGVKPFPPTANLRPDATHDITAVGLERLRCYAQCPAYTVIIQADGSFRYVGEYNVERLGEYTGRVSQGRLNQVLAFVAETDFAKMNTSYTSPFLDGPTVYTMVAKSGDPKVIENYANSGPATLWAIEQLIDDLLETAEWEAADTR